MGLDTANKHSSAAGAKASEKVVRDAKIEGIKKMKVPEWKEVIIHDVFEKKKPKKKESFEDKMKKREEELEEYREKKRVENEKKEEADDKAE